MAVRTINKFIKPIQRNLFPELKQRLGLVMNNSPINDRATIATFSGELNDTRVLLEFSSNHKDLQQELDKPVLFVKVFYGSGGNEAGIINLNNISEAVDQIYSALYELGYRSEQDKADEELEKQEKERKAAEEKEKAKQKEKEDEEKRKADLYKDDLNNDSIEDYDDSEEIEKSITDTLSDFDRYLNVMKDENTVNGLINVTISTDNTKTSYKMLNIDLYYISANMCLVQTSGISPKIDKATTWEKAKDYIEKVARKVNGAMSISAVDENGSDIVLPSEEENNTEVGIDI